MKDRHAVVAGGGLGELASYWNGQRRGASGWCHPDDEPLLASEAHAFNLDHPVSPFVGDLLNATLVILGANAGYEPTLTPSEFPDAAAEQAYLARVRAPSHADWSFVSRYYDRTNYGAWIADRRAVLVNACAYRSPKISAEPETRRLLERLPSVRFARRWLTDIVLPRAEAGEVLVIAKRPGLWALPSSARHAVNVVFDPAPVSPQLTAHAREAAERWLATR